MTVRTLCGVGLHSGARVQARLSLHAGPTTLVQGRERAPLSALSVARTDWGVCVVRRGGELRIDLVEHLFSAMAALHAHSGILIDVVGPELPILDGGCLAWLDALTEIGVRPGRPRRRILRAKRYQEGGSSYEFEPSDGMRIEVCVDYGPGLGEQRAQYDGDLAQFRGEIAAARTFGFLRDKERLKERGRAASVDPSRVLVFDDDGNLAFPAEPPQPAELARHKLLDLCGDLLLYGGLPVGRLSVERPGHTQTHAVLQQALADGVLAPLAATH